MNTKADIIDKPILILGGGGQAIVLIDCLHLLKAEIEGIADLAKADGKQYVSGVPIIGGDDIVWQYSPDKIRLVNALGSVQSTAKRRSVFNRFKEHGYLFATVIHPSAVISTSVKVDEGVQIMAGAIIQPGSLLGKNAMVNTRASVDHNCIVGDHVHIAPGVTLSGGVELADGVHVGAGAVILQNIRIGRNSVVGAGAVVTKDVPAESMVVGIPAKVVRK